MSQLAWIAFLIAVSSGFVFFFFAKRDFDFLNIAYIGAVFYFAPLFVGTVLQSSSALPSTIQPAVYAIATGYLLGLVLTGIVARRFQHGSALTDRSSHALSEYYVALALFGLAGAVISTRGAIINADKVLTLKQVGYFYILFEIAASLSCVSAVIERRWRWAAVGAFLLSIDLLVGFRPFVVLTSLSVALVLLMHDGRIRLYLKAPTYGIAAVVLLAAMLLVHSVRFTIFDKIAAIEGVPAAERVTDTPKMRSDTIQFAIPSEREKRASAEKREGGWGSKREVGSAVKREGGSAVQRDDISAEATVPQWMLLPLKLFEQSEPFIVQATLVGVVHTGLSCSAPNIFKSLFLLVPPGAARFLPDNLFPPTFYDEYQPILYPKITYGTGGNIWAEMLCRFGYVGMTIFGLLLLAMLAGLRTLLLTAKPVLTAPIVFGGSMIAFYIYRNDLHYTLVLLRQVALVFAAAYGLSVIGSKMQGFLSAEN